MEPAPFYLDTTTCLVFFFHGSILPLQNGFFIEFFAPVFRFVKAVGNSTRPFGHESFYAQQGAFSFRAQLSIYGATLQLGNNPLHFYASLHSVLPTLLSTIKYITYYITPQHEKTHQGTTSAGKTSTKGKTQQNKPQQEKPQQGETSHLTCPLHWAISTLGFSSSLGTCHYSLFYHE